MSHVPHDLHDEFPEDGAILHDLKVSDPEFRSLAENYHHLNREIHRVETDIEPASDDRLHTLKKQRLALLDTVQQLIADARKAA